MFLRRSLVAGGTVLAFIAILVIKLVHLQVVRHDYYLQLSQGNRVRIDPIPPNRGLILDRNGVVMAENLPAYQLELTAEQTPDIAAALEGLRQLGLVESDAIPQLLRTIRSRRKFEGVPIRLRMSDEEVATFAVRRHEFPGIDIRPRLTRHYPLGEIAVHALGYVGAISEQDLAQINRDEYAGTSLIGKLGLEAQYEKDLHGDPGFRQILVNAQGRTVESKSELQADLLSKAAIPGNDLILSIDMRAQTAAEEGFQGRRGAVVALDPANGDVIAFVSRPGFDPNHFGRGLTPAEYNALQGNIDRPLFNRALRGTYPPGSTVKPVIALAGVASNMVDPHQHRFCNGQWRMPGVRRPWSEGRGGRHGYVDLEQAIAVSCDVYFYGLSDKLGVDRISSFMAPFGFGALTGVDLPGEKSGILPSRAWKQKNFRQPEERMWFPGDTINFGIGQGYMTVTPLQLANVAAIIGSHGKHFKPRLATGIRDAQTGIVRPLPKHPLPDIKLKEAFWEIAMRGMEGAVKGKGTAMRVFQDNKAYTVAGKTGTAQAYSVDLGERYNEKTVQERLRDHSWFIAFAPVENPRIALVVLVENGGFGASAAAPIARKVMDAYLLDEANAAQQPAVTVPEPSAAQPEKEQP